MDSLEENGEELERKKSSSFWEGVKELVRFTILSLLIIIPFRTFIAQPFVVNGTSMDPTFKNGDYLVVNQISYRFEKPARGEVIIFKYPGDLSKSFIKRVIGLPGETVEVDGAKVTIKNLDNPGGLTLTEPYIIHQGSFNVETTLKDDEYFVMGDNRAQSLDSRYWGPLKRNLVIGKPFIRLLPVQTISLYPGNWSARYSTKSL
ncbi:MAG: signal peptidase I [Patescibacteria group bacterium]